MIPLVLCSWRYSETMQLPDTLNLGIKEAQIVFLYNFFTKLFLSYFTGLGWSVIRCNGADISGYDSNGDPSCYHCAPAGSPPSWLQAQKFGIVKTWRGVPSPRMRPWAPQCSIYHLPHRPRQSHQALPDLCLCTSLDWTNRPRLKHASRPQFYSLQFHSPPAE